MKNKNKSFFDAIKSIGFMSYAEMFALRKGEVQKVFINTKDAHYIVSNSQITCTIETFLKVRYKSGKSQIISVYTATGISKCAPDDKFNLLTGIKLATARAENDYNIYYSKQVTKYFNSVSSFASRLDGLLENCAAQLFHNNHHFIPSLIENK